MTDTEFETIATNLHLEFPGKVANLRQMAAWLTEEYPDLSAHDKLELLNHLIDNN